MTKLSKSTKGNNANTLLGVVWTDCPIEGCPRLYYGISHDELAIVDRDVLWKISSSVSL